MSWGSWFGNVNCKWGCVCACCSCVYPSYTLLETISGTCSGQFINDDASILISGITNADETNISLGSIYTGASYGDISNIALGDTHTFTGLTHNTNYTIRLFNASNNCFFDIISSVSGSCPPCILPSATTVSFKGSCFNVTGATPNNDAFITINNIAYSDEGNFTSGLTYTGPTYGDPSNFDTSLGSYILTGLTHDTNYTIRLYNSDYACFTDITARTASIICPDPCLTAGTPSFDVTYTFDCNDSSIDLEFINVSGGTPPYEYSVDGGATFQSSPSFPGIMGDSIIAVVKGAGDCVSLSQQEIFFPPEYYGYTWVSYVGLSGYTGNNDSVPLYDCLGNGDYRIRGSGNDYAAFDLGTLYKPITPLVSGETYQVDINLVASITPPGGSPATCPRIYAEQNPFTTGSTILFDTANPADEPTTCAQAPNTYTFTFTYGDCDQIFIWFGRKVPAGNQISNFTLVNFTVTKL